MPASTSPTPIINGDARVGSTLTVTNGGWVNGPTVFRYSWESCETASTNCERVGTNASSYTVTPDDLGRYLKATVTASNDSGEGWASSAVVGPVVGDGVEPTVDCTLRVPGADLRDCDLSDEDLAAIDLSGANLTGANLSGSNLSGATLVDVIAATASFYQADLSGADLSGANLVDANLEYAELSTALLDGADARRASFFFANAIGTSFAGANLADADFTNAELTDAALSDAAHNNTVCPSGVAVSTPEVCE